MWYKIRTSRFGSDFTMGANDEKELAKTMKKKGYDDYKVLYESWDFKKVNGWQYKQLNQNKDE